MKEDAIPRNIKHATKIWMTFLKTAKITLNVTKKPVKYPWKFRFCRYAGSKSKQLLNFRNTIYLTEWFQQQTEFKTTLRQWRSTQWINVWRSFTSQSWGNTGVITREIICCHRDRSPSVISALQQRKFHLRGISKLTWVIKI